MIKNTNNIKEYLIDLELYYNSIIIKHLNKKWSITHDKRFKNNSKKQEKQLQGINAILTYYNEKQANITAMIKKIENGDVKKVELEFM